MGKIRRLIVCLDGTWNQEDDSTNVLHHFHLVRDGEFSDGGRAIIQKKKYFRGVGTGPLDRITGGGFGFGLEQNVRDAYNWLVENFNANDGYPAIHGDDYFPPDEIYIFGFSRGAYTARSLVGFIGRCGLLERGAPLTVNQLWREYCLIGREREDRQSFWNKIFPKAKPGIQTITDLKPDPWKFNASGRIYPSRAELNSTERLLVDWSRRVRITYLGIYDTVGAIGWDALAIPGLRSKLALHHNMRPTTIIQNCRHALAIHENRSSFNHTPLKAYLRSDDREEELQRGCKFQKILQPGKGACLLTQAMWNRKIKQRWFVGAHSNVGGGYPDNLLAQHPFSWLLREAESLHLLCERFHEKTVPTVSIPTDSYWKFAPPIWTMILRAKRNYRKIDPAPEHHATRVKPGMPSQPGYVLKQINEWLDDSVFAYFQAPGAEVPPNLIEYARRRAKTANADYRANLERLAALKPVSKQTGEGLGGALWLALWCGFAAIGFNLADKFFLFHGGEGFPLWLLIGVGVILFTVDWAERAAGFHLALAGGGSRRKTLVDSLYWCRALGVVLFFCGFLWVFMATCKLGNAWFCAWYHGVAAPDCHWPNDSLSASPKAQLAGLLLLLQVGLVYFANAYLRWIGQPMSDLNLGSIVKLQLCRTPAAVGNCLDGWRDAVSCGGELENRTLEKLEPVRECLWRDIIGFIPLYTVVLGFGTWLAARQLELSWLNSYWWTIPTMASVGDYFEDICHLKYLRNYFAGTRQSIGLVAFSFCSTLIKFLGYFAELILSVVAVILGCWNILHSPETYGWRGVVVVSSTSAVLLVALVIAVWAFIYWSIEKSKSKSKTKSSESTSASAGG